MSSKRTFEFWLIWIILLLGGLIFAVDVSVELGVAVGAAYVGLLLLVFHSDRRGLAWIVASVCSILVLTKVLLSPAGGEQWKVIVNRGLSVFVIWVTAIMCWMHQKESRNAIGLNRSLEDQRLRLEQALSELSTAGEQAEQKTRALLSVLEDLREDREQLDREVKKRQVIEESLRRHRDLLESIHLAQTQFILAEDPLGIFSEFLKKLLALTDSEYGFIDEMFYDSAGKPYLTARAITDISWNEESRKLYQQFVNGTLNFTNLQSLFGVVMESGKPVIANDAPNDPRRTGIPSGHPPLKAFLGLPLISNSKEFVGVIGLANRPGGYHEEHISYLEPMLAACANLIAARKNDLRRQEAEQDVRRARDELESRVQERTAELERANLALQTEITERHRAKVTLQQRTEELERFNRLMVGREERMIELKRQVNELDRQLGRPATYDLSLFIEQERGAP